VAGVLNEDINLDVYRADGGDKLLFEFDVVGGDIKLYANEVVDEGGDDLRVSKELLEHDAVIKGCQVHAMPP
jgi:hypothetical protein